MTRDQTHACPYCGLIYRYHNEVKDHIVHEHPEHAKVATTMQTLELPR